MSLQPPLVTAPLFPSIEQCLLYATEYGMYENIRQHSLMVARVADTIHSGLTANRQLDGALPERGLVIAGALLHDIAKALCLQQDCRHADVGEQICRELGYPAIAPIVRDHVRLSAFTPDLYARGIFGAAEIVYYADKRVKHDRIVDLEDRLAYILDKYSNSDSFREKLIHANFRQCQDLESYLFAGLPFSPDELADHINATLLPE